MRVTGLGKIVLLLLIIGAAVGGWRFWQNQNGGATTSNNATNRTADSGAKKDSPFKLPFGKSNDATPNSTTTSTQQSDDNGGTDENAASGNDILLVTNPSKKDWLVDQIEAFNNQNGGRYRIVTKYIATREAMHSILDGKVKPAIWAASSTIWTTRLAQAWQEKNNSAILKVDDPASYRVFFRSPLVFLTSKSKLAKLKPILGSPEAWSKLRAGNGAIKFAHSDPLTANSGMMTLGLILANYADQTAQGDLNEVAKSEKFRVYMQQLERGLVYDLPAETGTSALTKAFGKEPNRYQFITTYESNALEEAKKNPQLAVIYPNPTAVSETIGALVDGDWLSDTQREGAKAFLQYLGTQEALRAGLKYNFRPTQSGGSLSLANELAKMRGQGFQQSFSSVELPPYEALNAAAFQWRIHVAHKPVQ